jgi:hypothetical protein
MSLRHRSVEVVDTLRAHEQAGSSSVGDAAIGAEHHAMPATPLSRRGESECDRRVKRILYGRPRPVLRRCALHLVKRTPGNHGDRSGTFGGSVGQIHYYH